MFLELLLVTLFLVYGILKIMTWHMEKVSEDIPELKSYPIIGHAYLVLKCRNAKDVSKLAKDMMEKTSDSGIMKFWFGPILAVAISDPKYIEAVSSSPHASKKGPLYTKLLGEVFDGVVMGESGQRWKELRKPLTNSFTKKIFSTDYHFVFVRRISALAQHIRDNMLGVEFDVSHLLSNLFLDIFSVPGHVCYKADHPSEAQQGAATLEKYSLAHFLHSTHSTDSMQKLILGFLGNEVKEPKFNFAKNGNTFVSTKVILVCTYHFYFIKLGDYFSKWGRSLRKIKEEMNEFYQWVFEERRKSKEKRKDGVEYYSDFLLRRKEEKKLRDDVIRKELMDVAIAASSTSATTSATALVFLAMFPDIQEEVYQEQLSIFGNSKRDATVEDVSSMVYLTMVIKETLRLTGVPAIFRKASEDIKIDDCIIPKGAYIHFWLQKAHRNPKHWETPNQFNPKHFLPEKESARPRFAFVPFGVSPRICAGFQYGLTSVTILLSTLLRNFEVKTSLKFEELEYEYSCCLKYVEGTTSNLLIGI